VKFLRVGKMYPEQKYSRQLAEVQFNYVMLTYYIRFYSQC